MASTSVGGHDSAAVTGAPDPRLRSIVAGGYCGWTLRPDRMAEFVLPAHTSVQFVLKVEDSALRPPEFVHGATDRPTTIESGCAPRYLQADLTPLGAYRVFGIPMHHVAGRLVNLGEVLGPEGRRLGSTVRDATTWRARFDAVDRFLLGRVDAAPSVSGDVAYAWHELTASGGSVPIRTICRDIGWSHKHLITRFRQEVGITPKRAARLIRFERALGRIAGGVQPDWASLAAECGYADQAHLIRDFGEFAGTTPASLVRRSGR